MPVTADDIAIAVRLSVETLADAPDDWEQPAGALTWTCWETTEHIADSLFYYAAQIGRTPPPEPGPAPFTWIAQREGGPGGSVFADRAAGPTGLLQVVDACGALLTSVVRTTAPTALAHHVFGLGDPRGFAAMGIVEVLVHTHDVTVGLGLPWHPPTALCARVLARLFPDVTGNGDAWATLLWATGRADLPDRPHRDEWRWHSAPLEPYHLPDPAPHPRFE